MEENGSSWQELYQSALLELEKDKLAAAIDAARRAIEARLQFIESQPSYQESELQALNDALHNLRVLTRELKR